MIQQESSSLLSQEIAIELPLLETDPLKRKSVSTQDCNSNIQVDLNIQSEQIKIDLVDQVSGFLKESRQNKLMIKMDRKFVTFTDMLKEGEGLYACLQLVSELKDQMMGLIEDNFKKANYFKVIYKKYVAKSKLVEQLNETIKRLKEGILVISDAHTVNIQSMKRMFSQISQNIAHLNNKSMALFVQSQSIINQDMKKLILDSQSGMIDKTSEFEVNLTPESNRILKYVGQFVSYMDLNKKLICQLRKSHDIFTSNLKNYGKQVEGGDTASINSEQFDQLRNDAILEYPGLKDTTMK